MLQPLLLLLVVMLMVFEEESHVVDATDSGMNSHFNSDCVPAIQYNSNHHHHPHYQQLLGRDV